MGFSLKKLGKGLLSAMPVVGPIIDAFSTHSANKASMRFNERMASTEWQRGVKDMLSAGINPMLAVSQGGNSAPTVSLDPVTKNTGHSAAEALVTQEQVKNMRLNNELLQEQVEQQRMITDAEKVRHGIGGGTNFVTQQMWDQAEKLKHERMTAEEQAKLAKTNAQIRDLEKRIVEQTMSSTISSARNAAQLSERQVTFTEIQTLLATADLPEKEAMAAWFEKVGQASPMAKATMSVGQWLKMIFGKSN